MKVRRGNVGSSDVDKNEGNLVERSVELLQLWLTTTTAVIHPNALAAQRAGK